MDTRREFLRKSAMLSGGVGLMGMLPESIQRALAIDPAPGSSYLDAEHIVLLMQENRSFDHCFGSLQGVRGFNDPRAIRLPNKNLVWLQSNAEGETYAPFRLNLKDTKATWMSSLPHSWTNQVDARNNGKYDKWLDVKHSGNKDYEKIPLTMGYYTREDIPFYYALADAFTVCDQHFCSSLTGTTPNRLYFWTGTIRAEQHENSKANLWNEEVDYDSVASWAGFPERLEQAGISWKIYQNDLSVEGGFTEEEDAWLANFGDNPLEYFTQYHVKLSQRYIDFLEKMQSRLPTEIEALKKKMQSLAPIDKDFEKLKKELDQKKSRLTKLTEEKKEYTREKYEQMSEAEKKLHEKAFCTNKNDPFYHELTTLKYKDGDIDREVNIPKGDVFHQFRQDVKSGSLPTVSWLVAPETFSDHPSSAWYGAWYVSEVLDILTQNPEVWKKTIFILTYDENDGYFDHVAPFVAPNPRDPKTGRVSNKIDARVEYVSMEQEKKKVGVPQEYLRESSIGLGYRVPLVIASPWSRGGWVNSQVFDHSSSLQFLEKFLSHKMGKPVREPNISDWRRATCGDLSSNFRPYNGEKISTPKFVKKDEFIVSVHKAKFKGLPTAYRNLTKEEIALINQDSHAHPSMPRQEKGIRSSCALPYQLDVEGKISADRIHFEINFESRNEIFGEKTAGSPFSVYAPGKYEGEAVRVWSYALTSRDSLKDSWPIAAFENDHYHLQVYGPNGFFREFSGNGNDPELDISCSYQRDAITGKKLTGNLLINLKNTGSKGKQEIEIIDNSYGTGKRALMLNPAGSKQSSSSLLMDLSKSFGWYDFSVKLKGSDIFFKRYAGRVETGKAGYTDPAMGK